MEEASLARRTRFSAGHHYRRPGWTEEENRRVFGDAVTPHAHDWTLEVTVQGPIDERTGMVVDLVRLDEAIRSLVGDLEGRELNDAIPEVREGGMVPSTESLARWFWTRLEPRVPGPARLVRVRVAESDDLAAEFVG